MQQGRVGEWVLMITLNGALQINKKHWCGGNNALILTSEIRVSLL